jgi:protocatechuate 3,4-dioxygenase alpha subunit
MTLGPTPSQTVGPFFSLGMMRDGWNLLAGAEGDRIRIEGRVVDGDGKPVPDALVEIWQADARGNYPDPSRPGFSGFGRAGTDDEGRYWFETIKPGPTVAGAPHINVHVFARGLLDNLTTRIYFSDERANDSDPVLTAVPQERRSSLIATAGDHDSVVYHFDIVLQGDGETVFFEG